MCNFTYFKYEVSGSFYFLLFSGPNPVVFNLWFTGFFQGVHKGHRRNQPTVSRLMVSGVNSTLPLANLQRSANQKYKDPPSFNLVTI